MSAFISGSGTVTFAAVNAALATANADISVNNQKITNLATPTASGGSSTKGYVDSYGESYGTLVASLSGNVSFTASETKTVHTITPTNGQITTYRVVFRAVPATNDGTGGGVLSELVALVRKSGGTVVVSSSVFVANIRTSPLNGSTNSVTASSGNLLIQFTTSSGAATLTRCDVYADASI